MNKTNAFIGIAVFTGFVVLPVVIDWVLVANSGNDENNSSLPLQTTTSVLTTPMTTTRPKTRTLLMVLLDASGSMSALKDEVITGFNGFVGHQRLITTDSGRLFLAMFDTDVTFVYKGLDLKSVPTLTRDQYRPKGWTALYDAINSSVTFVDNNKAPEEQVIYGIITDGLENSSKNTSKEDVIKLIKKKKSLFVWKFFYVGHYTQKWSEDMGLGLKNVFRFNANVAKTFSKVNDVFHSYRSPDKSPHLWSRLLNITN